ncbi:glycosyltransferase family 2 protein [Phocaeicola plebeius]|uniref:glycosyltransferase family 2 protein n=1 Tax=Phocaeicola plebeius TaxID=310297 RepID=UPI0026F258DF|nr:glycosyltransferase family 2 protein [Phocaeicola plebeius]
MISIITPAYNASFFLTSLSRDIQAQTFKDYEWIIVDDGSTDNSLSLIKKLSLINPRIKIVHQSNQGVSAARNAGISIATGEWICFLDADDDVTPDWLQNYANAIDEQCDIIFQGAIIRNKKSETKYQLDYKTYSQQDFQDLILLWQTTHGHIGSAWSKLIKSSLIKQEKIQYNTNINNFEDWVFLTECLSKAIVVKTIDTEGYIYNHQNSTLTGEKANRYTAQLYFNIFNARYEAAQKIKKINITSYHILLRKISIILLQGIKEMYRSPEYKKVNRLKILREFKTYETNFKGLNIKNKVTLLLLNIKYPIITDYIFQFLFIRYKL